MDEVINRFARTGSMKLAEFIRELRAAGFSHWRSEVIAELSRRGFALTSAGGQTWIVGLSPRAESSLRQFIDTHCVRSDGLTCRLSAIVKASGMKRTEVIERLSDWGFDIKKHNGGYVVAGLGMKEVYA